MKTLTFLAIAALVAVVVSPASAVGASTSATSKGLDITMGTDYQRYEVGQPIDLVIMLTNRTGQPLNYELGNTPIYDFWATTQNGTEVWRLTHGRRYAGTQRITIRPGETKIYRETWNQLDNQGKAVAAGWYDLHASFGAAERDTDPIGTHIKIDANAATGPVVIIVQVGAGIISPVSDIGKSITVDGILRQGSNGLYIEVRNVTVKR